MDHIKLSDELRQQLLESAAWGKAGITPVLREETEEVVEEGTKKGRSRKTARKAYEKPVEDASTEHEDGEDAEELEEAVHVCPLCVSQLEEAIDEERILEHLNVVVGLVDRLSHLEEGEEDIETVIDETIQELLFQDLDEEEE